MNQQVQNLQEMDNFFPTFKSLNLDSRDFCMEVTGTPRQSVGSPGANISHPQSLMWLVDKRLWGSNPTAYVFLASRFQWPYMTEKWYSVTFDERKVTFCDFWWLKSDILSSFDYRNVIFRDILLQKYGIQLHVTLLLLRPEYSGITRSIPWLLMPWLLLSPGHQQSWYWLCTMWTFLSSLGVNIRNLWHFNVKQWGERQAPFFLNSRKFNTTRVNHKKVICNHSKF